MREYLTGDTFFNQIAMVRPEMPGSILVVEGEDDYHVLRSHASDSLTLMAGTGGREHLLRAAAKVVEHGIKGVLFLIDSDFDDVLSPRRSYPATVHRSSRHDLVMDLLAQGWAGLDAHIAALVRHEERNSGRTIVASAIRERAINIAAAIARVRLANERHVLRYRLRDFPIGMLQAGDVSPQELARIVGLKESLDEERQAELRDFIIEEERLAVGLEYELVGDHDFFRALAYVLRLENVSISSDHLMSQFIASVDCLKISGTNWFRSVNEWCAEQRTEGFTCGLAV